MKEAFQNIGKEAIARSAGAVMVASAGGGYQEDLFNPNMIAATPIVRSFDQMNIILPDSLPFKYQEELNNIDRIRDDFDYILGVDTKYKLLSWDPVKSRNRYEQCKTEEDREGYKKNEWKEVTSTLRERYGCIESPMDFFLDESGQMRNVEFPVDTVETILERGVAYQETHGSDELERERSEVIGFKKLQAYFADESTEIGSAMIVFSPPGKAEGTSYTERFVDRYVLKEDPDTSRRIIEGKRFRTAMSDEDYYNAALSLVPDYFNNEEGPMDAILLRNPIKIEGLEKADEIVDKILVLDPEALRGYEFQIINMICGPWKEALIKAIINWDPEIVAEIQNTLLHIGDEAEALLRSGDIGGLKKMLDWSQSLTEKDIQEEIYVRGGYYVEERQVGCGQSASLFENSVGKHGFRAEDDPNMCRCAGKRVHFHCPGKKIETTKDKKGNESKKVDDCKAEIFIGDRTKQCKKCGLKATC